jgi:hypothetical protein
MKDKWSAFCDMTNKERRYLVENASNGAELDWMLTQAMEHQKIPEVPVTPSRLYDEAGKLADGYTGGGWMQIRELLVDFYYRMNRFEKSDKPGN